MFEKIKRILKNLLDYDLNNKTEYQTSIDKKEVETKKVDNFEVDENTKKIL